MYSVFILNNRIDLLLFLAYVALPLLRGAREFPICNVSIWDSLVRLRSGKSVPDISIAYFPFLVNVQESFL